MTGEQTAIPVPEAKPTPKVCAWCGAPATLTIAVGPGHGGTNANGSRMQAVPLEVPVCGEHDRTLQRVEKAEKK